jgi:hypothetical protein
VSSGSSLDKAATDAKAEHVFLDLLRRYSEQGRDVSHKVSPSYAPTQFAKEETAQTLFPLYRSRKNPSRNQT